MKPEPIFPILLRTCHADVRVTRRSLPATGFPPGAAAKDFAVKIIGRYSGVEQHGSRAVTLLRRAGVGAALHVHQHFQVASQHITWQTKMHSQVTPRLNLSGLRWDAGQTGGPRAAEAQDPFRRNQVPGQPSQNLPAPLARILPEVNPIRALTSRQKAAPPENEIERVVASRKRIEMSLRGPAQLPAPAVLPLERAFRKTETPVVDEADLARMVKQKVQEHFDEHRNEPAAQMMPQAPAMINQLADQVIRQIDHRILAQRERLGKV